MRWCRVNLQTGEEDAFGVTSLLYTLCALTVWYLLKLVYVLFVLAVTPFSLNLLASSFLGTGLCNPTPFKQLPWANWHLIATAWGAYCVYLCGRLRHLLPTFFAGLVLLALIAARKVRPLRPHASPHHPLSRTRPAPPSIPLDDQPQGSCTKHRGF